MENIEKNNDNYDALSPCLASESCAEHARLWDDLDDPCDDGRGYLFTDSID